MKTLVKNSLAVLAGCVFATTAVADVTNSFEAAIIQVQYDKRCKTHHFRLA